MKTLPNIQYGNHEKQLLDIYVPSQDGFDTIIWFHGGGLEWGDRSKPYFTEDIVNAGYAFVAVEYRMYPQAKFPDFIEDAAASVAFVASHIKEYGGNGKIYVTGQSAGAYLTMMLCLNPAYLENAGVSHGQIAGFISDSAQQTVHFNILRERGMDTRLERIDEAAPLYFVQENTSFSKLLMLYYSNDMPSRKEQNLLIYSALKRFCPDAVVELMELPGGHCADTGDYIREMLSFISA